MEKLTITEALSEVNLLKKKIQSKQTSIQANLFRPKHMKDQFESVGGSKLMIERERQAINSLNDRLEKIRAAISKANIDHNVTIGERTKSIVEWLTWKRETAASHLSFLEGVVKYSRAELDKFAKQPQVYKDPNGNNQLLEVDVNVDIAAWTKDIEDTNTLIEQLDGKLSLRNATIVIQF